MTIINDVFTVHTKGNTDIIDITPQIRNVVYNHVLQNAVVYVYAQGRKYSHYLFLYFVIHIYSSLKR